MAHPITVPRLGWSMDEGTFVQWLKQEGETVREGEPLFSLESEKAVEEVPAIDAGILTFLPSGPNAGDTVSVGSLLGYLLAAGEARPEGDSHSAAKAETNAPVIAAANPVVSPTALPTDSPRLRISPRARRAARQAGLEPGTLHGTGRHGRIRERDVLAAVGDASGEWLPISSHRRTIAARMSAGVHEAAPVTLTTKVDASRLVSTRERARAAQQTVPGFTELLVKLAAETLVEHPQLTLQWRGDRLFRPHRLDIAVAIDTEQGLVAPVVRDPASRSLSELSSDLQTLAQAARTGTLKADQMQGGVFTVSNLGMFGIDAFTPILNLPQTSILGVGCLRSEAVVEGDRVTARPFLTLSLTFDHRAMDGAPAARFLQSLCQRIQRFGE